LTFHPVTGDIDTIRFRDGNNLNSSDASRIYPGSKNTVRRIRAARALLCTPYAVFNAADNRRMYYHPKQIWKIVEPLLRNLSFRQIIEHASTNYAVQVGEMAWLREAGIRKLGEYLGKDVDWLFPNILSNYVETRKRAWMSCYDGDRVSPVKKRPVIDDDEDDEEEEERCSESSDDDEDLDYVDEDYTEKAHDVRVPVSGKFLSKQCHLNLRRQRLHRNDLLQRHLNRKPHGKSISSMKNL